MIEKFIVERLLNKRVDVFVVTGDKLSGRAVSCDDGVLTLESEERVYSHIAVDKIVSLWKADQPWEEAWSPVRAELIHKV